MAIGAAGSAPVGLEGDALAGAVGVRVDVGAGIVADSCADEPGVGEHPARIAATASAAVAAVKDRAALKVMPFYRNRLNNGTFARSG